MIVEWLKTNLLGIIVFTSGLIASFLVTYKKNILLEVRISALEAKTISLEKEIKEELKEIKDDIKKLLARD